MLPLVIASLALSGAVLCLFVIYMPKIVIRSEPHQEWVVALDHLDSRQERLELKWIATHEELQDRLERGTEQFRKAKQTEAFHRRKTERQEDEGEQLDLEDQEILPIDERGSDPRGLSYMPEALGDHPEPAWKTVGRDLAQQIAQGRGN